MLNHCVFPMGTVLGTVMGTVWALSGHCLGSVRSRAKNLPTALTLGAPRPTFVTRLATKVFSPHFGLRISRYTSRKAHARASDIADKWPCTPPSHAARNISWRSAAIVATFRTRKQPTMVFERKLTIISLVSGGALHAQALMQG